VNKQPKDQEERARTLDNVSIINGTNLRFASV